MEIKTKYEFGDEVNCFDGNGRKCSGKIVEKIISIKDSEFWQKPPDRSIYENYRVALKSKEGVYNPMSTIERNVNEIYASEK